MTRAQRVRYGLTRAEADDLERIADGRCCLCSARTRLVVDHDHDSGFVRGLLCKPCNAALGWFERNEARVADYRTRAASWLARIIYHRRSNRETRNGIAYRVPWSDEREK